MLSNTPKPQAQVLTIDDEPEIVDIIKACLEGAGYKVLTATSAAEGLKVYEKNWRDINLVLLDFLMPEMNGDLVFECLQRINSNVRVILLTGCDDQVARSMFAAGLCGYIQKPFYIDDLVFRVGEEVERL